MSVPDLLFSAAVAETVYRNTDAGSCFFCADRIVTASFFGEGDSSGKIVAPAFTEQYQLDSVSGDSDAVFGIRFCFWKAETEAFGKAAGIFR